MRFHPEKPKSKKYLLKVLSPILLLIVVLCFLNFDTVKRSIVDVNMRSTHTALLDTKFKFIEFFSSKTEPKRDDLIVKMSPSKYVNFQKERARKTKDYITNKYNDTFNFNYYKAKVKLGNGISNSELKLFGNYPDHFGDSDGHSFRLKFNGDEGFGKKKINVLKPITRSFNLDRMLNIIYNKAFSGLDIKSNPINVIFNKEDYGIYLSEDFLDKYLIEENFNRESFIFEIINKNIYFNHEPKGQKFLDQKTRITELVTDDNTNAFFERINDEKLFGFLALTLVLNNNHQALDINLHWFYNPLNNTFEPTIRETKISEIKRDINEDEFYTQIKSIIGKRNTLLTTWMSLINESEFNLELSKAITKIKPTYKNIKQDSTYTVFKDKLVGFKSEMTKNEKLFQANLEKLKLKTHIETIAILETITIAKDTIIDNDFIVSKHQGLIIEEGTTLTFTNNANLLVYGGQLNVNGTETNRVNFIANAESNSSIYINTKKYLNVKNASFTNLSGLKNELWQLPSAITLFESRATFYNCEFSDNQNSDDMINLFRCDAVSFKNCVFSNIKSDAIDSDFSNVKISKSTFSTIGNDGVDSSGSFVTISYSTFTNVEDKAISAGEKSTFKSSFNSITNSELGLVCKDGSLLVSIQDQLENNTLDLVLFKKKAIYPAPTLQLIDTKIHSNLIEQEATISGLKNPVYAKNINKKLYGNAYGKASE